MLSGNERRQSRLGEDFKTMARARGTTGGVAMYWYFFRHKQRVVIGVHDFLRDKERVARGTEGAVAHVLGDDVERAVRGVADFLREEEEERVAKGTRADDMARRDDDLEIRTI